MVQKIALWIIRFYQISLSPLLGGKHCKFSPSCSDYAYEAITTYGCFNGVRITFLRLIRCHPFSKGGYDPLPVKDSTNIVIVSTLAHKRKFHALPRKIYANDPHWIEPLVKDIDFVFDPKKNIIAHKRGKLRSWIAVGHKGETVGRIVAFTQKDYNNRGDSFPVGGVGFFECTDSQEVADLLFDTAKAWLTSEGMQAMDGPINFGERNRFWGLLVSGRYEPLYGMNYHPQYYQRLFEQYGFREFYQQFCYGFDVEKAQFSDKIKAQYRKWYNDSNLKLLPVKKNQVNKFAVDFAFLYNAAWKKHGNIKEMSASHAANLFRKMSFISDEVLSWFVYYKGEPIAFIINVPEINDYFKYLRGRFFWREKLRLLWMRYTKKLYRVTGVAYGIHPTWQGKGINQYLVQHFLNQMRKKHYRDYEVQWIGDFNTVMVNSMTNISGEKKRTLITYRCLFDTSQPFARHPFM